MGGSRRDDVPDCGLDADGDCHVDAAVMCISTARRRGRSGMRACTNARFQTELEITPERLAASPRHPSPVFILAAGRMPEAARITSVMTVPSTASSLPRAQRQGCREYRADAAVLASSCLSTREGRNCGK